MSVEPIKPSPSSEELDRTETEKDGFLISRNPIASSEDQKYSWELSKKYKNFWQFSQ
jgi:hypothetical protein